MIPFLIASALSFLWAAVHLFVGGRDTAAPLRAAPLELAPRATVWMCWHFVSVTLVLMGGFFLAAAFGETALGLAATMLAGAFVGIGLWAKGEMDVSFAELPQGWLFVPVAILRAVGLLS
ncbi:MAG: hypothetical protein MK180_04920 [Rhodobacteraceae bacterium]|nr:hypothetical protein [Paracoccaceae bacterium]